MVVPPWSSPRSTSSGCRPRRQHLSWPASHSTAARSPGSTGARFTRAPRHRPGPHDGGVSRPPSVGAVRGVGRRRCDRSVPTRRRPQPSLGRACRRALRRGARTAGCAGLVGRARPARRGGPRPAGRRRPDRRPDPGHRPVAIGSRVPPGRPRRRPTARRRRRPARIGRHRRGPDRAPGHVQPVAGRGFGAGLRLPGGRTR